MARITRKKLEQFAHRARHYHAGVERLLVDVVAMLDNPRAKYGRVTTLIATARDELSDGRSALRQIEAALAVDRPRTEDDNWPTAGLVAELLKQAAHSTEQASITLRVAADTLTGES